MIPFESQSQIRTKPHLRSFMQMHLPYLYLMALNPFYLAGEWITSGDPLSVLNPWNGQEIAQVAQAALQHLEQAVTAAMKAREACRRFPAWKKYEVLHHIARRLGERKEEFASLICAEAGKPIRFARMEVDRAITTFTLAADAVRNLKGEVLPLDLNAAADGRMGMVNHYPVGIVLAISPFNFPLNLVAHKVAPAIAAGNAVIHKPASKTPLTALLLASIVAETQWPAGGYHVLPCAGRVGQQLVSDERIPFLSFTGSPEVGWGLKATAGRKKMTLELGGDAAAIISPSADLQDAAQKCALGAFMYAGQVCISIQRMLICKEVYEPFVEAFLREVNALAVGDPGQDATIVGPMIDSGNCSRIESWIGEALQRGARMLNAPSGREGNLVRPQVLSGVQNATKLGSTEAFAPVVMVEEVKEVNEAIHRVNESRYGLQAALFTDSQTEMRKAWEELEVGGLVINQSPTFRSDNMPYGGVKESGLGREGVEYAIREMMEPRLLVW